MQIRDVVEGERYRYGGETVQALEKLPARDELTAWGTRRVGPHVLVAMPDGSERLTGARDLEPMAEFHAREQALDAQHAQARQAADALEEALACPDARLTAERTMYRMAVTLTVGVAGAERLLTLREARKLSADERPSATEDKVAFKKRARRVGLRLARGEDGVRGNHWSLRFPADRAVVASVRMTVEAAERWAARLRGDEPAGSALEELFAWA